ncbi:MAG: hypothetical protein H6632_12815 [Anaerolineales bacterium]|nr:hypothetical protein [Anaerolineales bacterium]
MRENHGRTGQTVVGLVGNVCLDILISVFFLGVGVGLLAVISNLMAAGRVWPVLLLIGLVSLGITKYVVAVFDEG